MRSLPFVIVLILLIIALLALYLEHADPTVERVEAPTPTGQIPLALRRPPPPPTPSPTPIPTPTPTPPPTRQEITSRLLRQAQGNLVLVEGRDGAGSGFICNLGGQKFLVTNAHVLASNSQVNFTLLDGSQVAVGAAAMAVGHDIVRLTAKPGLPALDALEQTNENLLIGDEVLVPGNEKGAHVITPIHGNVVGLGPNLVEVDAPFQSGNSGSPIIHVKTGKAVGIATYYIEDRDRVPGRSFSSSSTQRRFGYRLDSVKTWQPLDWAEFQTEAAAIKKVDELTDSVMKMIQAASNSGNRLSPGTLRHPALQRPFRDFYEAMDRRPSAADALQARQRLLDNLRNVCQSDLADLRPRLRYDYFQRQAGERQRTRDELAKAFEEAVKAQAYGAYR